MEQEFWVRNQELVNIYEKRLGDAGYINFKLGRTNNRGDGMFSNSRMAIESSCCCLFLLGVGRRVGGRTERFSVCGSFYDKPVSTTENDCSATGTSLCNSGDGPLDLSIDLI